MVKVIVTVAALLAAATPSLAQTPGSSENAEQVAGLFAMTCLSSPGNPADLRDFMKSRYAPKLSEKDQAIFLRDKSGVGYDASNDAERLILVSEDNGACSVFAEKADAKLVASSIEASANALKLGVTQTDHASYEVKIKDHAYRMVVAYNPGATPSMQVAVTLSP